MKIGRVVVVAVGAIASIAMASPAASAQATPNLDPSTVANALDAMHGEALAHAKYLAFAAHGAHTGKPRVAAVFRYAAEDELNDHFANEARLIGFVGSNEANLRDAIAGEQYEATTMYPDFARQAMADGCDAAADLFTEIATDEAHHADLFMQALQVITDPNSGGTVPVGEAAVPVPVTAQPPACHGQTAENLKTAMGGEAFAHAKYTLYARYAARAGFPRLARLFTNAAGAELTEHFAEEANLAGLVGANARNLGEAIAGETYEATTMYPEFARAAAAVGDMTAAALFREIAGDETHHARAFAYTLFRLLN